MRGMSMDDGAGIDGPGEWEDHPTQDQAGGHR
jgi:hypothetical protein